MIRSFTVLCLAIGTLAHATVAAGPCDKTPKDFFLYDTESQAKRAGVDYNSVLVSAFGRDKAALATLLQLTAAAVLDGAGAQTHAEVLWSVLQCWGDGPFAQVFGAQTGHVRQRVRDQLLYATEERKAVRSSYPKTFRTSASKTSNRRINPDPRQLRSAYALRAGYAER